MAHTKRIEPNLSLLNLSKELMIVFKYNFERGRSGLMTLLSSLGHYFYYHILITASRVFHCGIFIHVYNITLSQHWPRFQMEQADKGMYLQSQNSGGKSRQIPVSLRPAWSTE